jgi:hypothetical protein
MFTRTAALGAIAFSIALSASTASALAGNGNGGSQGNSAAAPGQTKKEQTTSTTASSTPSTTPAAAANASSHAKTGTSSSGKGSASQNSSTSAGIKPTNATLKNQWAPASSNRTKRYGNGQTAGQIATRAGAGSAMLYGPGNSQPHKTLCGGHMVDVHALKAHAASCAASTPQQSPTPTTTKTSSPPSNHGTTVSQGARSGGTTASSAPSASAPATSAPAGGTLGATAQSGGHGSGFGGVLGAVTTVGHGTLPFTGFPLWAAVLAGVVLVLGGVALARRARPTLV